MRVAVAVGFVLLAGCGHSNPAPVTGSGSSTPMPVDAAPDGPVTLDRDLPKLAERALALYEAVAEAFTTAGEDCTAATTKLDELATTYGEVVAANAQVLKDHRAKELRAALAPHQERFDAAAKTIMSSKTMSKCAPEKPFEQAFERLMGTP